jgi:hypothetical protein
MTTAFLVSVLVLTSLLVLWDRHVPASLPATSESRSD